MVRWRAAVACAARGRCLRRDEPPAVHRGASRREGRPELPRAQQSHRSGANAAFVRRCQAGPGGRAGWSRTAGQDLAPLLVSPGAQAVDAARPATLFTYSGLASNDAGVFDFAAKAAMAGKDPKEEAKRQGFRPDLKKRGHVRSAFDGRYRFTRYFSPLDHNSPATLDELFQMERCRALRSAGRPGRDVQPGGRPRRQRCACWPR